MDSTIIWSNLEYGCKLLYEMVQIPVSVLNENGKIAFEYNTPDKGNPSFLSKEDFFNRYHPRNQTKSFPLMKTTEYQENLIYIPFKNEDLNIGSIILGPTTFPVPTKVEVNEIISKMGLEHLSDNITDYYEELPIIGSWKFLHAGMFLYYVLYQEKLDISDVLQASQHYNKGPFIHDKPMKNISEQRINFSFHHDPLYEKQLYQFITDGKKDDLLYFWRTFKENHTFEYGILSTKSELRNQKNLAIATITQATRAAIAGQLHPEIAYTLGDTFIQELEDLNTVNDVHVFKENALYEFADHVSNSRKQKYSKSINTCLDYIFRHIYEDITLTKLANHISLNAKYLSSKFKKEIGIPISEYIQQTKIDEAKKLITFTDYSLTEIHALLNYSDQSYFTKVFKKFTGITPKQYKNRSGSTVD